jgi:PadR family transcriptional regulator PadR
MGNKRYIKGFLEDIVLHLIDEHGQMYGYELTKKVMHLTSGAIQITEGALYPILHKLENEQKLSVEFKKANGRIRKYYALTPEGGQTVSSPQVILFRFLVGMQQLLNLKAATK